MIKQVVYNQLVVGPSLAHVLFPPLMYIDMDSAEKIRTIPALTAIVTQFVGCILIREVLTYYGHRLLHKRYFYERYHKIHHQWTAPIAITAMIVMNSWPTCSQL